MSDRLVRHAGGDRLARRPRSSGAFLALAATLALSLLSAPAEAGDGVVDPSPPGSPKRALPSYDGRTPAPTPAGDYWLDIPRFLLAPPYLVNEYVLRRPLGVAIPAAEKVDLFTKIYSFFAFGPDHKAGIFPVGLVEFDFQPSVGILAFWDDVGFKGNDLTLHVEAWPTDWFGASLSERIAASKNRTWQFRIADLHRPDYVFYGVGPRSLESSESRYGVQREEAEVAHEWRFWRSSRLETRVGIRDVRVFDGDNVSNDPTLTQEAKTGAFAVPYGYGRTYTAEYNRLIAAVDSRKPEPRRGSGARLELDAEEGSDLRSTPMSAWLRYGASAAGYVDLTGYRRVLGLTVSAQFADPLGPEPVPFTELVYLGGDHPMRGFFKGRLVGRSAADATLSYSWPIGAWIDGDLQLAVGNVFDDHLRDFSPGLLRYTGAVGLAVGGLSTTGALGSQDAPVEILVGLGSETFDHGGQVDSIRVMLGSPRSF